ncbi:MAG: motility associated factor glycosyltransferase family protein [Epsilonproteobacteria bacterium]|nr:motility associated factor glycosyltransferase family protein [Campylobacterota bacterium]
MNNIQKKIQQNYLENINYLQNEHPKIFDQIVALETAIDKGYYKEKYALEYKDGYFDLCEKESGKYLYNQNSIESANVIAKSVNYKKNENVFETFFYREFTEADIKHYGAKDVSCSAYYGIIPIVDYVNKYASKKSTTMKKIQKFVFLGTGLGLHIETVHKKIKAKAYLIIEDDLELFRLSLFTLNYAKLATGSKLYFWIFDDEDYQDIVSDFLSEFYVDNHYIKFFHLPYHKEIKFKQIQSIIASQEHLTFTYTALLQQYLKPLSHLKHNYPFINIANKWHNTEFSTKPVLMIAAGPSLQNNIEWLQHNKEKFILVAVSAALSLLEKYNITPDIVTHIDGFEASLVHFDNLKSKTFLQNTLCIFSASVTQEHIERVNTDKLFIYQNLTQYKENFGSIVAPCVGSQTIDLLLRFGSKEIYLMGLDLALNQTTGETHANTHIQSKKLDLTQNDEIQDTFTFANSTLSVKGNLRENVVTTSSFISSINAINRFLNEDKDATQSIYNLNDGAFFNHTNPTKVETIPTNTFQNINKSALQQALIEEFQSKSEIGMNEVEHSNIKTRIIHAKEMKEIIQRYQNKKINSSTEEYKKRFILFIDSLLAKKNGKRYDLSMVYFYYFNYIVTYIFDLLNTKELNNHKEHMKHINNELTKVLLEIEEYYEEELQRAIDS